MLEEERQEDKRPEERAEKTASQASIEKALLDIRPDVRKDGGDFIIEEISPEGQVTLKIKGTKKNKARNRETLHRLLDYVLRKSPQVTGYDKIIKVDWHTPSDSWISKLKKKIWK